MLVDVEVLIGSVLALLFLLSHQELVDDYFFSILVGSNASVDKLYDFPDVLGFYDVGHDVRHYLTHLSKVL
jgi:hypothetical protein